MTDSWSFFNVAVTHLGARQSHAHQGAGRGRGQLHLFHSALLVTMVNILQELNDNIEQKIGIFNKEQLLDAKDI